jgi:hypothetical protein
LRLQQVGIPTVVGTMVAGIEYQVVAMYTVLPRRGYGTLVLLPSTVKLPGSSEASLLYGTHASEMAEILFSLTLVDSTIVPCHGTSVSASIILLSILHSRSMIHSTCSRQTDHKPSSCVVFWSAGHTSHANTRNKEGRAQNRPQLHGGCSAGRLLCGGILK